MPPCLPAESPTDPQAATVSEADSPALRTIAGGGAPGDLAPTRRRPVEAARRRCRAPTAVPPRLPRPLGWSWGDDDGAPQTPLPAPMALGRAAPLFPRLSQSLNGLTELIVGLGGGGEASYFIGCLLERYYGLQYSRTKGSRVTPCSSLRVEGPQPSIMSVLRGEDSENDTFEPVFRKKSAFLSRRPPGQ